MKSFFFTIFIFVLAFVVQANRDAGSSQNTKNDPVEPKLWFKKLLEKNLSTNLLSIVFEYLEYEEHFFIENFVNIVSNKFKMHMEKRTYGTKNQMVEYVAKNEINEVPVKFFFSQNFRYPITVLP